MNLKSDPNSHKPNSLNRVIGLPLLILYGVGVTVGAGIFALSGEIVGLAGNFAPWSFMLAGLAAGLTAVSYSILSADEARAAGEAWYVSQAFGKFAGTAVGLLLVLTAIFSSAAISVSFANYAATLLSVPVILLTVAVILLTAGVAVKGIKETVIFSALITSIEVGALMVIIYVGFPSVTQFGEQHNLFSLPSTQLQFSVVLSGALVAFFAFIGFEDIVNMGDEAVDANRNLPIAILCTLLITVFLYVLVVLVCVATPDRSAFLKSGAPLAYIFEVNTGKNAWAISLCAAVAMINGILVQIVMSSRVLYGLSTASSLPSWFSYVNPRTKTPVNAIVLVSALVAILAVTFSLVSLAVYSSIILLLVFSMVNFSLWRRGSVTSKGSLRTWRYWGLLSGAVCVSLLLWQLLSGTQALGH